MSIWFRASVDFKGGELFSSSNRALDIFSKFASSFNQNITRDRALFLAVRENIRILRRRLGYQLARLKRSFFHDAIVASRNVIFFMERAHIHWLDSLIYDASISLSHLRSVEMIAQSFGKRERIHSVQLHLSRG